MNDNEGVIYLGTETWYGPGYCGICGTREEDDLIARVTRYWDPDDGWKLGVLCKECTKYMKDRGPREGDYAYGHSGNGEMLDELVLIGDPDFAYAEAQDLGI